MGSFFTGKRFLAFVALPYLLGFFLSHNNLPRVRNLLAPVLNRVFSTSSSATNRILQVQHSNSNATPMVGFNVDDCYAALLKQLDNPEQFSDLQTVLHRNGESEACGTTTLNLATELRQVLQTMSGDEKVGKCPAGDDKYQVESLLTRLFQHLFRTECTSPEDDRSPDDGFYGFCDMGEARTPILLDHQKLVPVRHGATKKTYLPCHFHDSHGVRVTSLPQLSQLAAQPKQPECRPDDEPSETCAATDDSNTTLTRQLHLYAIQAGRVFLHTPSHVGQIIPLPHVRGGDPNLPVFLEVLSVRPAVFDVHNFFTRAESQDLVDRALAETKESHRMKRSSTGAQGYTVNDRRTSENGFDTDGKTSMAVKRRCFDVLGFDDYIESHADGLQILRYNLTTAYIPHMDWIDGNDQLEHDYESGGKGGNRFATILLYMSDLKEEDGGETVFTEAWPIGQAAEDHVDLKTAIQQLRESEKGGILEEGSWQESMAAKCRTRLAIRPNSARAVLFYSQLPNGKADPMSLHGGCPVLSGTKYAANLWAWNTPRAGYPQSPKNPNYKSEAKSTTKVDRGNKPPSAPNKVTATFRNDGSDPALENAELFFRSGSEDSFWGKLGHFDPSLSINTYPTHQWVLKVNGEEVKLWTIESSEPPEQEFVV